MTNIGFRVLNDIQRPEDHIVAGFQKARPPTPNVTDVMGRFGAIGHGVHPVSGDGTYLVSR